MPQTTGFDSHELEKVVQGSLNSPSPGMTPTQILLITAVASLVLIALFLGLLVLLRFTKRKT